MHNIFAWWQSLNLKRIIVVFLSGLLLFVSTACGGSKVLAKTADQVREEVPEQAVTSTYKGGMNDYSDVDPRVDTSAAEAKAKGLVDKTRSNLGDRRSTPFGLDNAKDNLDRFGENVQEGAKAAGNRVQRSAKEFGKGTERGTENIKENAQKASKGIPETFKEGTAGAQERIEDAGKNLSKSAQKGADNLGDVLNSQGDRPQTPAKNLAD